MEQQTGSKLGKEYVKAEYCHLAYLTSMKSTSWGGRRQDGGGIGRGDHFLSYKFIKRTIELRANFTKQLLIISWGHQAPRKAGGRRQVGGERGRLGPKDRIPYHTANRPPDLIQRLPEILDGRHPLGGSWLNTGCMHPTGTGWDWGWGCGGEKACRTWGECARQAPGCLSRLDGEGTKSKHSFLFRALWNTRGLEPRTAQGTLHIEQPGAWAG